MSRVFVAVLVSLSMVSIADGGLLRPCSCDMSDAGTHCAAVGDQSMRSCCADTASCGKSTGCSICPQPREPRDALGAAVEIQAPARDCPVWALGLHAGPDANGLQLRARRATPAHVAWRWAPEGLAIFLI